MEKALEVVVGFFWMLGTPFIASLVLWLASDFYYRSFGQLKIKALLITGAVGTPVHELSHAVTACLFGMKVTRIMFFKPDPASNTLGYVTFSYRRGSLLHLVGLFFVGLSPLIFGSIIVYKLFECVGIPNLHRYIVLSNFQELSFNNTVQVLMHWTRDLLYSLNSWQSITACILAIMIGVHSTPSKADLKGSFVGFITILAVVVALANIDHIMQLTSLVKFINLVLSFLSTAILQLALLSSILALFLSVTGLAIKFFSKVKGIPPRNCPN